jgi:hypothetical protein
VAFLQSTDTVQSNDLVGRLSYLVSRSTSVLVVTLIGFLMIAGVTLSSEALSWTHTSDTVSKLFSFRHPYFGSVSQPIEFRVVVANPAGELTTLKLSEGFNEFNLERVTPTPVSIVKGGDTTALLFASPADGSLNISLVAKPTTWGQSNFEVSANVGEKRSAVMSANQFILP